MQIHKYTDPWPFVIVDDLLDPSLIDLAIDRLSQQEHPGHFYADDPVWKESGELLRQSGLDILNKLDFWFDLFPHHGRSSTSYQVLTYASRQFAGHSFPPHCENPLKFLSFVTYVFPEQGIGTQLHRSQHEDPCFSVPWRCNRTLVFAGRQNVTWHSYLSGEDQRITINHFVVSSDTNEL